MIIRLRKTALLAVTASLLTLLGSVSPARAGSYVAISGSGSSWSSVALDQWSQDVRPNGIVVNFNPDGSAAGRQDYMANQVDFAASDPPFRNGSDKLGNAGTERPSTGFSYIPDTAGGTAFMYHLTVAGKLVTNLRLSGKTIMKIFTGQITNWDDKTITKDYGAQLPSQKITPVIRSDGSGATFFFTRWMAHSFPSDWNAFCSRVTHGRVRPPCGQTEFYPQFPGSDSQAGSNNVATYITASFGEGAIGYDEYAYALNSHYPVVKVLNPAGYYSLPSASNVAVALTQAQINQNQGSPDFLQQNLDNVYTYNDPRSYPLSSYSYLIVPRTGSRTPPNFTAGNGRTLSTFVNFFLCAGQRQAAELGYSPLPINLVKGGFLQVNKIPGHVPTPAASSLESCQNPTFLHGKNILLSTAPQPSPCDKVGEPLNCIVVNGKATTPGAAGASGGGAPSGTPSAGATTGPAGAPVPASSGAAPGIAQPTVPVTGTVVNVAASTNDSGMLAVLTAVEIVLAIAAPPAIYAVYRRRRRQAPR